MTQMILPTGGTINYGYTNFTDGASNVSRWISQRTTPDSTTPWTYTPSVLSSCTYLYDLNCQQQVTVMKPSGDYEKYTFTLNGGAWPTEADYYDSTTLLASTKVCYTFVTVSSGACTFPPATGAAPTIVYKTAVKSTLMVSGSPSVSRLTEYSWDTSNNGNVRHMYEWNFGSDLSGAADRTTDIDYYSVGYVINRPTTITKSSGGSTVAKTINFYDESGSAPSGCSSSGCGDLTTVRRYIDSTDYLDTHYHYTGYGMLSSVIDPMSNTTTYSYDSTGAYQNQIQFPNTGVAHTEYPSFDSSTGLLSSYTDQNGNLSSYGYDSMGRPTSVSHFDGGSEAYSYTDSTPNPYVDSTVAISSGLNAVSRTIRDGLGRPIQVRTVVPATTCSAGYSYVDTTYDSDGRVSTVSNPYCTTGDSTYGLTTYHYDGLDRVKQIVPPDGGTGTTVNYVSNCKTVTDQAGKARKSCTDGFGRTTGVWEDPSGLNYETDYAYDGNDNLTGISQGSQSRGFVYDWLSRLTSKSDPESGSTGYSYDADSNVSTKTDARGITTTYGYDALNRLTHKYYSDGTVNAYYNYDESAPWGYSLSNPRGNLTTVYKYNGTSNVTAAALSYDSMGRVNSENQEVLGSYSYTAAHYNYLGQIDQLTYPSGRVVTMSPNVTGLPSQVRFVSYGGTATGYNYLSAAAYAPNGAPTSLTLGSGVQDSITYNVRLQSSEHQIIDGSSTWADRTNWYATAGTDNGNVTSVQDNLQSNRTQSFNYDSLNRLSSAYTAGTHSAAPSECWGESYGYDRWGNLNSIGALSSPYSGCVQDNLSLTISSSTNRITSPSGFSYDSAGNLLSDGVSNYGYDAENRLASLNGGAVAYIYDALGNRVSKNFGSWRTDYVWFNGNVITQTNDYTDWTDYVYSNGQRLARATSYEDGILASGVYSGLGTLVAWFDLQGLNSYIPYVVQSGDKLVWRQSQGSGTSGGMYIGFSDSTNTTWTTYDSDGQLTNSDGWAANAWHQRRFDLSSFVGKTITDLHVGADQNTTATNWWVVFADIAIVSADGTVRPFYNGQSSISLPNWGTSNSTRNSSVRHLSNVGWLPDVSTSYYHQDHLGSSRLMTGFGGWPIWSGTFLPFGMESNAQATVNNFKFTGQERDSESSLDNFHARYYSFQKGRFMSPDPLAGDIGDPQSLNRYAYVRNNPLTLTDPTGMDASCDSDASCGSCDFCFDFSYIWAPPVPPPVYNPPNPSAEPNPPAGDPDPNGPFSGPIWQEGGPAIPICGGNLACLFGIQMPDPFISDATDNSSPFNGPSYSAAQVCAASALLNKGGQAALDIIGIIPGEGTILRSAQALAAFASVGIAIGTRGNPADAALANVGVGLWAVDTGKVIQASETVAKIVPIVGNVLSGISAWRDIWGAEGMVNYYNSCMAGKN